MKQTTTEGSRARKELKIAVLGSSLCWFLPFRRSQEETHLLSMYSSGRKRKTQWYFKSQSEKIYSLAKENLESVEGDTTVGLFPQ